MSTNRLRRNGSNGKIAKDGQTLLLKERLAKQTPQISAESQSYINWRGFCDWLGQPFDEENISISRLKQMRRDAMISFGLVFCKMPIIRASWYIKAERADVAAFVDGALRRIYSNYIFASLNKLDFGYSPMVKRFELTYPDWTYLDMSSGQPVERKAWEEQNIEALIWKNFLAIDPADAEPAWDENGDFAGIYVSTLNPRVDFGRGIILPGKSHKETAQPNVPLEFALWSTNEKESSFGSLWGYPRIAKAHRYWWSSLFLHALSDRHLERHADPSVLVYFPAEDDSVVGPDGEVIDLQSLALSIGQNIRSNSTVALPSELFMNIDDKSTGKRKWEIEVLKGGENIASFKEHFSYLDIMKLRSVMVPEQALLEGQGGTSSRNVAEQMGDMFFESQAVLNEEEDMQINRYMIPQLVEANFGPGVKAEKVTTGFSPKDRELMRTIVQLVGQQNPDDLNVDVTEILRQNNIPLVPADRMKIQDGDKTGSPPPPPVEPKDGFAGVNQYGQYVTGRARLYLGEDVEKKPKRRTDNKRRTTAKPKTGA